MATEEVQNLILKEEITKWTKTWTKLFSKYQRQALLANEAGIEHYEKDLYNEALIEFLKASELHPTNTTYIKNVATTLNTLNRYKESIFYFEKALQFDSLKESVYNGLGNAYYGLYQYKEAIKQYKLSLKYSPENTHPINGLANSFYSLKKFNEAEEMYRKVLSLDDTYIKAFNGLGNTLVEQKRYEESIEMFKTAIERDNHYIDPYNGLAYVYFALKRYEEAVTQYQNAMKIARETDPSYCNCYEGMALIKLGEYEKAKEIIQNLVEIDKQISNYNYYCYGLVLYKLKNYELAYEKLKNSLGLNPTQDYRYKAAHYFAMAYLKKEKVNLDNEDVHNNNIDENDNINNNNTVRKKIDKLHNEAIENFSKAIEDNKEWGKAYYRRGEVRMKVKEYEKALDDFRCAIANNAGNHPCNQLSEKKILLIQSNIASLSFFSTEKLQ